MISFRSTLNLGGSFHAWPDSVSHELWPYSEGHSRWSLPQDDGTPGEWRSPLSSLPTKRHGNCIHSTRFRAISYWFGVENYLLETDETAQQPGDEDPHDEHEDIVPSRRARLVRTLPMTLEKWQDVSLDCVKMLSRFPTYYDYEGRYDERAEQEKNNPASKFPIFQNAVKKYDWDGVITKVETFLQDIRSQAGYEPNNLKSNVLSLGNDYRDTASDIYQHLHLIHTQRLSHDTSHGRCEEYDYHTDGMIAAMKAIHTLSRWVKPWTLEPDAIHQLPDDSISHTNTFGWHTLRQIVPSVADAYQATGAEQYRLMLTSPVYTMESGLGPLLKDLPYLPEKNLNPYAVPDIAGRGAMLIMSGYFADAMGITDEYADDTAKAQPAAERISKIIAQQRQWSF